MSKETELDMENNCSLKIGDKAPAFDAETTNGWISFPNDFQEKWVI